MMDERVLQAILRFSLDQRGVAQIQSGASTVRKELERIQQEANRTREQMERLSGIGLKIAGTGAAITTPLLLSMRTYLQNAGEADRISQRWISATKEIEQSQARVGRVVASKVVPYLEIAAKLSEKMAEAAENNPGIIGNILGAGAALVGSGSLVSMVSQGIRLVADVKFLTAAALMDKAAGTMLTAAGIQAGASKTGLLGGAASWLTRSLIPGAAGAASKTAAARLAMASGATPATLLGLPMTAAGGVTGASLAAAVSPLSIFGGLGLGLGVNEMIARSQWGQQAGFQTFGKFASVGAYGLGNLFGGQETGQKWFYEVAKAMGEVEESARGASSMLGKVVQGFDQLSTDQQGALVKLMTSYQEQETEAKRENAEQRSEIERETEEERTNLVAQYGEERARLEADFERQRSQALEDHTRQMAKMAENFQRQEADYVEQYAQQQADLVTSLNERLADLEKNYYDQVEDLAHQHKERMRQIELNHQQRVEDLVTARDAIGLARENSRYAQEKAEENRQYQEQKAELKKQLAEQTAEARAEYARQAAELARSFEEQRAQREEEYQRQIQEQAEQFALQQKRDEEQYQERLRQLEEAHKKELQQLETQKSRYLAELQRRYEEERRARSTALRTQMSELLGIEKQGYVQMESATKAYVDQLLAQANRLKANGTSTPSGKAGGGYAAFGQHWLGERGIEYVLDAQTTRSAEQALGGPLSQERLMMALAGRGGQARRQGEATNIVIQFPSGAIYSKIEYMMHNAAKDAVLEQLEEMMELSS